MWDKFERFMDATFRVFDFLVILVGGGIGAAVVWHIAGSTEASELARLGYSVLGFFGAALIAWIAWQVMKFLS
jgi:hypothetical protein